MSPETTKFLEIIDPSVTEQLVETSLSLAKELQEHVLIFETDNDRAEPLKTILLKYGMVQPEELKTPDSE